jgi:hypothetical protein
VSQVISSLDLVLTFDTNYFTYPCEHAHAGMKRYSAVSAIDRNRVPDFDDHLMLTAAGLWNFYLEAA